MTHENTPVRTRFAPSPTGYLHLGGARTALYSWAYAKHHALSLAQNNADGALAGAFVLRIEDTDVERSTPAAVQAILDGMAWLGLAADAGPFYQMQHMARYRTVIAQMLAAGTAYPCYSSPEQIEAMREAARARGDKPKYDGTWRPEAGKTLPTPPVVDGRPVRPVVRFKNPQQGVVSWDDVVKGTITIANAELDDFIIARALTDEAAANGDTVGVPTYNFCVVVDDWDMRITHVIRGDDHVNNTPRQINVLQALGATLPQYGHLPMILGPDGEKLSKRHGAVSVMQYDALGYLPQALLNYLARLGWSHGDTELLTMEEMVRWFDGSNLSKSAAQWDPKKLNWVNAQYIKQAPLKQLTDWLQLHRGLPTTPQLEAAIGLLRDRAETLVQLADSLAVFTTAPVVSAELTAQHILPNTASLSAFSAQLDACVDWSKDAIAAAVQHTLKLMGLKMPQLAIPLRVAVFGTPQTPGVDAMLAVLGRAETMQRLKRAIDET
jgi:glutamyl-tRNA synthetase